MRELVNQLYYKLKGQVHQISTDIVKFRAMSVKDQNLINDFKGSIKMFQTTLTNKDMFYKKHFALKTEN